MEAKKRARRPVGAAKLIAELPDVESAGQQRQRNALEAVPRKGTGK
jgi:hypothetical protein